MRFAILANSRNSFPRVMAEGLERMFAQVGVASTVFYNGLDAIRDRSFPTKERTAGDRFLDAVSDWRLRTYVRTWRKYDALIIVGHNPVAFMRGFWNDDKLRAYLPNHPIILYDLVYLETRGEWKRWLHEGNPALGIPTGGHFGLERYDWYLCSSVVSEHPTPRSEQPVSVIGLNLDDGSLRTGQQKDFVALLDFARDSHTNERQVQVQALQDANVKWIELRGSYSIAKIRSIYRECSAYFVAHRESFGLPICELQACGSAVFTPYADWCPSHWMKDDMSVPGEGVFSNNFIVYNNDPALLTTKLRKFSSLYRPLQARETFLEKQPQLYYGDLSELKRFINLIESGDIDSNRHKRHGTTLP
jgi:hypothetical protein